jgi:hypothetical protein
MGAEEKEKIHPKKEKKKSPNKHIRVQSGEVLNTDFQ